MNLSSIPSGMIAVNSKQSGCAGNQRDQDSFASIEGEFLTHGLPLGRKVDCKPNCLTFDSTPSKSPNEHPRLTLSRTAASSFSVSSGLTRSIPLRGRGIGDEDNRAGFGTKCSV